MLFFVEISFQTNIINQDGNDQNEIMLLDANGCPTEGQIMGPLAKGKKGEAKDLVANFDAFKFPSSEVSHMVQPPFLSTTFLSQMVQFRALVTPCMPRCQPVECVYQDFYGGDNTRITSYGKRKRREIGQSPVRAINGEDPLERYCPLWNPAKKTMNCLDINFSSTLGGAGGGASEEQKLLLERKCW